MRIVFTGHRDRVTVVESLQSVLTSYPGAVWVHGGATGFDQQVERFARAHGIVSDVVRPDYKSHHFKKAPLIRDEQMVNSCDLVIACYDGRGKGGTFHTIQYARKSGKPVAVVPAISL